MAFEAVVTMGSTSMALTFRVEEPFIAPKADIALHRIE
jgi:hypothetical protein